MISSMLDGNKRLSGVAPVYPQYLPVGNQTDDMFVAEAVGGVKYDLWLGGRVEYMRTLPCLRGLINIVVSPLVTSNLLASRGRKPTCLRRIGASPGLHKQICDKWTVRKRLPYARIR